MSEKSGNFRTPPSREEPRSERLSRAYRDAVEDLAVEPSAAVDEAIRAAAHEAVTARSEHVEAAGSRQLWRRWRTPLALAATVLLAIGIALRVHKFTETETAVPRGPATGQSDRQESVAESTLPSPRPPSGERRRAKSPAGADFSPDAAPAGEKPAALTGEIPSERGASREEPAPMTGFTDPKENDADAKASAADSVQAEPRERPQTKSAANPFPGATPSRASDAASSARVPGQAAPPAAPGRSSFRTEMQRQQQEKGAVTPSSTVQSMLQRLERRPAEVWVEEIRTLKRTGREAEAAELLESLRKKFPDFVLPEDLR